MATIEYDSADAMLGKKGIRLQTIDYEKVVFITPDGKAKTFLISTLPSKLEELNTLLESLGLKKVHDANLMDILVTNDLVAKKK